MPAVNGSASLAPLKAQLATVHLSPTASLPLTIAIAAGLIRGNAVSPATWAATLAAQVRGSGLTDKDGAKEELAAEIESIGQTPDELADSLDVSEGITDIHFVNAAILPIMTVPGATTLHRGLGAWQVPLEHVLRMDHRLRPRRPRA